VNQLLGDGKSTKKAGSAATYHDHMEQKIAYIRAAFDTEANTIRPPIRRGDIT